jgi:transcriptional regulator with XRE-family HTH domain
METASVSFGRRLRLQRERRGLVLETIAASTKIKASLLADLERDDVSKWPPGIFRRAFMREYAASIGLEPESVVAEFVRLFPDEESGVSAITAPPPVVHDLRLTFADGGRAPLRSRMLRVAIAVLEACAVVAAARLVTWFAAWNFWTLCGALSLAYYGVASACCGRSPASWWLDGRGQGRAELDTSGRSNARDLLGLIVQQAQMRRPDGESTALSAHAVAAENLQPASGMILPS